MTVGSFDFPESGLLAEVYGQALTAHGFPVRTLPDLGSRELVDPALMSGLIQLVPEYAGSALEFVSLGRRSATSSTVATNKALAAAVQAFGGGPGLAAIGAVYLASAAIAAASPTPGELGAIEAALIAGLTGVGLTSGAAVSAVITCRLATIRMPVAPGRASLNILQRGDYI